MSSSKSLLNQDKPRIIDGWRSRIRHQSQVRRIEMINQYLCLGCLVVIMVGSKRSIYLVMLQQVGGGAGIRGFKERDFF